MSDVLADAQVQELRDFWLESMSTTDADAMKEFEDGDSSGSANLAFLAFVAGGRKNATTASEVADNMSNELGFSEGLTEKLIGKFHDVAQESGAVDVKCEIPNPNVYSISGNRVDVWLMEGTVQSSSSTAGYKVLGVGGVLYSGSTAVANANCEYTKAATTSTTTTTTSTTTQATSGTSQPQVPTPSPSGAGSLHPSLHTLALLLSLIVCSWMTHV